MQMLVIPAIAIDCGHFCEANGHTSLMLLDGFVA
jgi:hypothetical protein